MALPDINFHNLRKHRTSQNDGFEELTRQLVLADPPNGYDSIENRGPGADGGVEILVRFPDGRVWGWQSKFFLDNFGSSEVGQLKKSFKSALDNYTNIERYIVAIPRNLSGAKGGTKKTQTERWSDFKTWAASEAKKKKQEVEIALWDDSFFVSQLEIKDPVYAGMRAYWFDQDALTPEWFSDKRDKAISFIGQRYMPEHHVDLAIGNSIEILRRTPQFEARFRTVQKSTKSALRDCERLHAKKIDGIDKHVESFLERLKAISDFLEGVDLSSIRLPEASGELRRLNSLAREDEDFFKITDAMHKRTEKKSGKSEDVEWEYVYDNDVRGSISSLQNEIYSANSVFRHAEAELVGRPRLLIEGEAGSGKSHLLADEVAKHVSDGFPAIFVPARIIDRGDRPESEILRFLDLDAEKFEVWLGMMNSAALATGRPAIIAIDALNESENAKGWEPGLPTLIQQISKFPQLALVVSCRTAYRELCIRNGLDIVKIEHRGFSENLGKAAKEYLDKHGIERSTAPIFGLNHILDNPLFLSVTVRALQSEGATTFPRDLDNLARLLEFWLRSVERTLVDSGFSRIELGDGKLLRAVRAIGTRMAELGTESLPFEVAAEICEKVVNLGPPSSADQRLLQRLINEGVFLDFPSKDTESGKSISFGFQRFGDYFIAAAILEECSTPDALGNALTDGGKYAYVFEEERYYYFAGIRIALMSLCPERLGIELPRVTDDFLSKVRIRVDDFLESIPWRKGGAITNETVGLLEALRFPPKEEEKEPMSDSDWYGLLLEMAPIPNCPLNARYLKADLVKNPLGERDAHWSAYLVGKLDVYEDEECLPLYQLVDWAWTAPKQAVDPEQVGLVAISLALLTATMDRGVRDRATKALASLFIKYPEAIPATINEFADWDDTYVRERLLAAAMAGTLFCDDNSIVLAAALAADTMVFDKAPVERHAWTRRYAQIIVEHAARSEAGINSEVIARSRPPYKSDPIVAWPTIKDIGPRYEEAGSIIRSVVGYLSPPYEKSEPLMAGDFGRYTMGGIDNHFSAATREIDPPITRGGMVAAFWDEVSQLGATVAEASSALDTAKRDQEIERLASWETLLRIEDIEVVGVKKTAASGEADETGSSAEEDSEEPKEDLIEKLEREFVSLLPRDLAEQYRELRPFDRHGNDRIPTFSLRKGQCWVANRAIEIGWNKDIHENIERMYLRYSHGRHDNQVERIGKKYQHIAFGELCGYLADYHWYLDYSDRVEVLQNFEEFERSDIDPTYLAGTFSRPVEGYAPGGIQRPELVFKAGTMRSNITWTKRTSDIPNPIPFLVQQGDDGYKWATVNTFVRNKDYMENFESSKPIRSGQYGVELILVPASKLPLFSSLTTQKLQEGRGDVFDRGGSSEPFFGQRSCAHFDNETEFVLSNQIANIEFGRITDDCSPKYTGYDMSGVTEERDFSTPHPAIVAEQRLRPKSPWSRLYVDNNGEPAFVDEAEFLEGLCIIREDILRDFANKHDLEIVWRVWVEKDGGMGSNYRDESKTTFVRKDYLGFFFQQDGEWKGKFVPFRD